MGLQDRSSGKMEVYLNNKMAPGWGGICFQTHPVTQAQGLPLSESAKPTERGGFMLPNTTRNNALHPVITSDTSHVSEDDTLSRIVAALDMLRRHEETLRA